MPVSPPGSDRPKVSVVTITYNHEAFIAQALDSILAQETDFAYEVVVADDASTDATPSIVQDYAERYPDRIVPVLRPANVGIHANFVLAAAATRGDYVALCEGDDYWTDPHKLQRQADLLDRRPEVSLCAHPVRVVWDDGDKPDEVWPDLPQGQDLAYRTLLRENLVPTNSTLSRRLDDYAGLPDVMPLDWYLHLRHARRGDVAMLEEPMAVYRRHAGGVWYGSHDDPDAFWVKQAPAMAGFIDAVLELVGDDPDELAAASEPAKWVVELVGKHAQQTGDPDLAGLMADHPRFALFFARSYAELLAWHREKTQEHEDRVARLKRRLRRARHEARRLRGD